MSDPEADKEKQLFDVTAEEVGPVDAKSKKEIKLFSSTDEGRKEALKQVLHQGIVWGLRVSAIAVIFLFVIRVIHLGAPSCIRWLSPDDLQQIDHLLFSGALGGLLTRYMQDILPSERKSDKDGSKETS